MATFARLITQKLRQYLNEQRLLLGVTQGTLGRRLQRDQSTISAALSDRRTVPKLDTLARIADALQVELTVYWRPVDPITPEKGMRVEVFRCPCGFEERGALGELSIGCAWDTYRERWSIVTMASTGSQYQQRVQLHVKECRVASSRFHLVLF